MYITYSEILDNCGKRKEANFKKINEYVNKHKWNSFILPRHIKLLEDYVKSNMDLSNMSKISEISTKDLRAIFLRIESQFELYEKDNNSIFIETYKNNYVAKLKKQEKDKNQEKIKIINKIVKPNSGNDEKDKIIKESLRLILDLENYKEIFSSKMVLYIEDLLQGLSINDIAIKRSKNKQYILYTLIGSKNPRKECEKGLQRILEEYNQKK